MSLRLRLLLAVGAIALVALVVADFATYSALRTSLYNQVDQQLAQNRGHLFRTQEGLVFQGCLPQQNAVDGGNDAGDTGNSGTGPTPGTGGFPNIFSVSYFAVVSTKKTAVVNAVESSGASVPASCPAYVDGHPTRPQLPVPITGFKTQPDGSQVAYFTTGSVAPGGPSFRVRAEKITGNLVQVQALPLIDQDSTLHTLFLT